MYYRLAFSSVYSKANISWLWASRGRLKKVSFKSNTVYQVYSGSKLFMEGIQVRDHRVYVTHSFVDFS